MEWRSIGDLIHSLAEERKGLHPAFMRKKGQSNRTNESSCSCPALFIPGQLFILA